MKSLEAALASTWTACACAGLCSLAASDIALAAPSSSTSSVKPRGKTKAAEREDVPLPENAPTSPRGIDVVGEPESLKAAAAIAASVASIQGRQRDLQARILSLQDALAARFHDVSLMDVNVALRKNANATFPDLGIVELEATLNDIPLVHYKRPARLAREDSLPLYKGPLPAGEFELRLRSVVGVLHHGWPYALAQGRWNIDRSFRILSPGRQESRAFKILLVANEDSGSPEFRLETTSDSSPRDSQ